VRFVVQGASQRVHILVWSLIWRNSQAMFWLEFQLLRHDPRNLNGTHGQIRAYLAFAVQGEYTLRSLGNGSHDRVGASPLFCCRRL